MLFKGVCMSGPMSLPGVGTPSPKSLAGYAWFQVLTGGEG